MAQINTGKFKITFKDSQNTEITVQPDPDSLIILEQNYGQDVYNNDKSGSSGLDEGFD